MTSLAVDITTPQKAVFTGQAHMVVVPGIEGSMGFLPGHEPLVSALADGVVRLRKEDGSELAQFVVAGGYVQVTGEKVIILADNAIAQEDIKIEIFDAQLTQAKASIEALGEDAEASRTTLEAAKKWAELCLRYAQ